ncbi:MAG: Kelch repeat-containing protein [Nitriliruptorales bacterium]
MDVSIEARLRTELRMSAEALTVPDDLPARVERRIALRRRQALSARVAVAALGVAAMGVAVVVAGGDDRPTEVLPPAVGSPSEGTWEPLPEAPISARFQHAAAWTGNEMIVFGGYDGGDAGEGGAAAYSPATGTWRRLAEPPSEVMGAPVAVWTGTEVVAFGGDHDYARHGAIYDPQGDKWRTVSEAPFGTVSSSGSHAVWTGEQVLVVGFFRQDEDEADGAQGAALYDPATAEWTQLPDAPDVLPYFRDAVWTGDELVFIGAEAGNGARAPQRLVALALNPATATWRPLPAPPQDVRGEMLVAWTGKEIVVGGGRAFPDTGTSGTYRDAAAYDPVTNTWRAVPDAPVAFQGNERYTDVAVDGQVIAFDTADPDRRVLVLDPTSGAWRFAPGSNRPELTDSQELRGRREAPAVSTSDGVLIWGGGVATAELGGSWRCCRAVGEGALFTPPVAVAQRE